MLDGLEARGIPHELLVDGLPLSVETLRDSRERIGWDPFVELLERFEVLVGGPGELERAGYEQFSTEGFAILRRVASAFARPRDIYWIGTTWFGGSLFSIVEAGFEDLPGGRIRERLLIPSFYRDCPQLFHVMRGSLRAAPRMLGYGDARVEMEIAPRRVTYLIEPPRQRPSAWQRLGRRLREPFAVRQLVHELASRQEQIADSYERLVTAHEKIARQSDDLRGINEIGRTLAERIELGELTEALLQLLHEHLPGVGVALSLQPLDEDKEISLGALGDTRGAPTHRYRLETAGRCVGRLEAWCGADAAPALLEEIVPWVAIAFDNARSYAALRQHNEQLEARVRARTRALVSANERLNSEAGRRKQAAEALVESQERLRSAEHLASIGTLAAGIAHEINNPVASILAAAQFALMSRHDSDGTDVLARALKDVENEAQRCARVVRSVLQFSRNEPTEKWLADVNRVARRAVALTRSYAAEHGAHVELRLSDAPCLANLNPTQIEQVVVNLVRNAIEAGDGGVRIELATGTNENGVRIMVSDDGPGIAEEDRERILDPFYTTRRTQGGTGLGLSVAHGIVSEHGGSLRVDNRPGAGATISIDLPRPPSASDSKTNS